MTHVFPESALNVPGPEVEWLAAVEEHMEQTAEVAVLGPDAQMHRGLSDTSKLIEQAEKQIAWKKSHLDPPPANAGAAE